MKDILNKYPNFRESVIGVLTAVVLFLGESFGLTPLSQLIISIIGGSQVVGQGIANTNPLVRLQDGARRLSSKKFRFSILFVALTALGAKTGMSDLAQGAIGVIATMFNVGVGIADSKTGVEIGVTPPVNPKDVEKEALAERKREALSQEELNRQEFERWKNEQKNPALNKKEASSKPKPPAS